MDRNKSSGLAERIGDGRTVRLCDLLVILNSDRRRQPANRSGAEIMEVSCDLYISGLGLSCLI